MQQNVSGSNLRKEHFEMAVFLFFFFFLKSSGVELQLSANNSAMRSYDPPDLFHSADNSTIMRDVFCGARVVSAGVRKPENSVSYSWAHWRGGGRRWCG